MSTTLWIVDPTVLVQTVPINPFLKQLSLEARANAFAQLSIGSGILLAAHRRSLLPIVGGVVLSLLYYLILPKQQQNKKVSYMMRQQPKAPTPKEEHANDGVGYHGGVYPAWSMQSTDYPNNPGMFDYGRAVRSTLPTSNVKVVPTQSLARMYSKPGMLSFDQQTNPIPDPTYMARQPVNLVPNIPRGQYEILSVFHGAGAATGLGGLGNPGAFA